MDEADKGRLMTTIGEWVNVSSGTGSPGLSRTKSIQPKNGCACACVEYTKKQASQALHTYFLCSIFVTSLVVVVTSYCLSRDGAWRGPTVVL